ncbi:hypothetical protein TrRE_jg4832 [Triparma retinervis]|uniref:Uncharacterized protein n=1 Tax=Triparma retinervis TaxID=2557542 RepID=A0A9W7AEH7_9STRA|nr:hypothetical protein TrRE_jg4832 [Triparma retinervis]
MVIISVKKSDGDGFLYETTTASSNADLISELCEIWNARLRVRILAPGLRELGKYGPMKKVEEQGLDEVKEKYEGAELVKNEYYQADPSGLRTGNGPGPELAATLDRVATDAETYCDKSQVQKRVNLSLSEINDKIANMRGAVMMSYPMGLPEWDTIKLAMDSVDGLEGTGVAAEIMEAESAQLWCAGKEFVRGQLVSDRLGKNEKTKVITKLTKSGSGPPAREPAVNEEERKAMMAHYFKKQEEMKKLAESNDDEYLASAWADSSNMKRSLQGVGNIRAPGLR